MAGQGGEPARQRDAGQFRTERPRGAAPAFDPCSTVASMNPSGFILPIQSWQGQAYGQHWRSEKWRLRRGYMFLVPAPATSVRSATACRWKSLPVDFGPLRPTPTRASTRWTPRPLSCPPFRRRRWPRTGTSERTSQPLASFVASSPAGCRSRSIRALRWQRWTAHIRTALSGGAA